MCKVMEDMRNEAVSAAAMRFAENLIRATKLSDQEIADSVELTVEQVS